jgi:hypothetical protein
MRAANDITISAADFAAAIRSILPRARKKDLGGVAIAPAGAGLVRLSGYYASATVPAEGTWTDTVTIPAGRFMRGLVIGNPPPAFRLVFFGGLLAVNGATVTARAMDRDGDTLRPSEGVPTNRLGVPLFRNVKPHSR